MYFLFLFYPLYSCVLEVKVTIILYSSYCAFLHILHNGILHKTPAGLGALLKLGRSLVS